MSDDPIPAALRAAARRPRPVWEECGPEGSTWHERRIGEPDHLDLEYAYACMAAALRWVHTPWARPTEIPKCNTALLMEGGCLVCDAIAALEGATP